MSNNSLVFCKKIPNLERFWEFLGNDGQLFYDYRLNILTFRRGHQFITTTIRNNIPYPDIQYQIPIKEDVYALSYSSDKSFVAVQLDISTILIVNLRDGKQQKIQLKSWDMRAIPIVLFDWYFNALSGIDFFIVDLNNVRLYQFDLSKFQYKEIASQSINCFYAWFEPKSEVLLVASTSGIFEAIYFENFQVLKKIIKGPTFTLDLRMDPDDPETTVQGLQSKKVRHDFFTQNSLRNRNIYQLCVNEQYLDNHRHKIMFVFMYGLPTLIHVNMNLGKVYINYVTPERIIPYGIVFTVPCESVYTMSLVDNLLVVNNITENLSLFYDTKNANPVHTVSSPQSIYVVNDHQNVNNNEENKQPSEPEQVFNQYKQNPVYLASTKFMDYSLIIDIYKRQILTYEIDPDQVKNLLTDEMDILFFLIRREGCKEKTLSFLKEMIQRKRDIMSLSFVFNKFLEVLKKSEEEKAQNGFDVQTQMVSSTIKDTRATISKPPGQINLPDASPNGSKTRLTISLGDSSMKPQMIGSLKATSSYNVVQQSDIHYKIFAPLVSDNEFDKEYLIKVIMEYIRLSAENAVPLLGEIQSSLIRLILQTKQFSLLQSLLQFHCLKDNLDLAEVLIKLGTQDKSTVKDKQENELIEFVEEGDYYPEILQTGLDMQYRMNKIKDLIEHLLKNESIIDTMEFAKKWEFEGVNLQPFLEKAAKPDSGCSEGDVISFILDNVKRGTGEEEFLFGEDALEIIKNFQQNYLAQN